MSLRWISVGLCALLPAIVGAQETATLEGSIRDSHGQLPGAVHLQLKTTGKTLETHADSAGGYRFTGLSAGAYELHAESGASGEAVVRSVAIAERETKKLDLTLQYPFADEPNFIVAGVTDPTSRGGHGSDTVLRSAEALAKATAELGTAETRGDALQAVRAYQRAAELDPSEPNLFDWGSELLLHRAPDPAAEVFTKGHRLYPPSARMLLGLAVSWYARGDYGRAAQSFLEACDVNPADPAPYLFLGKVQSVEIASLPGYVARLARFAKLHPENPWANYYYAVALWRQRTPDDSETPMRVAGLLQETVRLDPALGAAYLQLGIVYSAQNDDPKAIAAFQRAIEISPGMDEPHYRLGQAYARMGEKEKARLELKTYTSMSAKLQEQIERERSAMRQFVIELRDSGN